MIKFINGRECRNFLPDLFGAGDNAGMNFKATPATLNQVVDPSQINALNPQVQNALDAQSYLATQYFRQNPVANQAMVFNQQQELAHQLEGIAGGSGPNPALNQLNQATAQNVNQQAALMASQRGAGANAGLIARQAAQQGGAIQQQAAGQAATLQAQQQLAGISALQAQQGQLASLANTQAAQLGSAVSGTNQAAQSEQQNLLNAAAQYNNANVANQSNVNNVNAGIANTTAQGQQAMLGGLLNGAAGAAMLMAGGGMVPTQRYADGGMAPQSFQARYLYGSAPSNNQPQTYQPIQDISGTNQGAAGLQRGASQFGQALGTDLGKGFNALMTPSMPGNTGNAMNGMAEGYQKGGPVVPGKAAVKGDNLKNDTVPAMLSPHEIVIPRSITMAPDAPKRAAEFVAKILARNGMRKA